MLRELQKAFAAVAQTFGRLDVLVNNAGIAIFKPILHTTYREWSRVLAVNLTGPFLCTQAAAPLIRDSGGGAVVNITSISGLRASTLRTAYDTSKTGLAHLNGPEQTLTSTLNPNYSGQGEPTRLSAAVGDARAVPGKGAGVPHE